MPAKPSDPTSLILSDAWMLMYPEAHAGILSVTNIPTSTYSPAYDDRRAALESEIKHRYSTYDRSALAGLPAVQTYENYYKKFKKTYHVLLQLESVALKGKSIPPVPPLIGAMFMAELKNQLLTAGHDFSAIQDHLKLNVAAGNEKYTLLNGVEQTLKESDMMISDNVGIVSSIIYGPDQRTRLSPTTQASIYTVYAPPGITEEQVYLHLEDIRDFILIAYPAARIEALKVYP